MHWVCQGNVPAPHVTEDRHVLCVRDDVREHTAQGGVDAGEHLSAAEEASWTTLGHKYATWVQLGKDNIPVKVLHNMRNNAAV